MRVRKALIIGGTLLALAILIPIVHHYQLRAATNSYLAELKAKGEPMDLTQVLPPPVPPDENSADTFRKAAALFKGDHSLLSSNTYVCMKMVAPGKAMVCSQQPAATDYDVTNSWEEVTAAVAENAASFRLLRTFIENPQFDFGINYSQGFDHLDFRSVFLTESKQAALRLQTATLIDFHRRDCASAAQDVRAMLAVVKGMKDERIVISELVRIAIAQIALCANWEILQSANITDEQLAALQDDWASLNFIHGEENALMIERADSEITWQKYRASDSELLHWSDVWKGLGYGQSKPGFFDPIIIRSRIFYWRYWWSYPDEIRAFKGFQILLAAPRSAQTNSSWLPLEKEMELQVDKLSIPTNSDEFWFGDPMQADLHFMLSSSIISLNRVFNRVTKAEAAKQMAIAIALKRYQLKHGKYPPELKELVSEFLREVPRDPIDGQPLRYRLNPDGTFLLYSIGDDGKDDGGDPNPVGESKSIQWQRTRDWVWPQPATAEEIQYIYGNSPK